MTPTETVLEFIEAINSKNTDKMVALLTPDHAFTDSLGKVIPGRRHVRDAWLGYLAMVPDYAISVREVFARDNTVVVVGEAAGTYQGKDARSDVERWQIPAAWRGEVSGDRLAAWCAYVDHEPLRRSVQSD